MRRRSFLALSIGGVSVGTLAASPIEALAQAAAVPIRAVAFDAFPIFDPRPILRLALSIAPDHDEFGTAWFNRIFTYTWLRTSGEQYRDFQSVIAEALDYTASTSGIALTQADRARLLDVWMRLEPWPDVLQAVEELRRQDIQLAFLSNFTEEMLRTNAANAGLEDAFNFFSTDLARAFKPDPEAYSLATDGLGLKKQEIAFVAFAAWDAAGASWFGFPTVWINRMDQPAESLGVAPTNEGRDMSVLLEFLDDRTDAGAA